MTLFFLRALLGFLLLASGNGPWRAFGCAYRASISSGDRVIPDPQDPKMIYITTFGGGVWYGSVDGEDRPLDIMTPQMQPGR